MRLRTWMAMTFGAAVGAGVTYLMDPDKGQQRRHEARELALQKARDYDLDDRASFYAGKAKGLIVETGKTAAPDRRQYDPKTLIRKVESEVIGPASVPTGDIVVDADDNGVVTLRGKVGSEHQIEELVAATRKLNGVKEVQNLLHLPSQPAPNVPHTGDTMT